MYTEFWDMCSGGKEKEWFVRLLVNLPKDQAIGWFKDTLGHDPENVTCDCCGSDYCITEVESPKFEKYDVIVNAKFRLMDVIYE